MYVVWVWVWVGMRLETWYEHELSHVNLEGSLGGLGENQVGCGQVWVCIWVYGGG